MRSALDSACASRLEISARPLDAATATKPAVTATISPIRRFDLIVMAPLSSARMFALPAWPVNGAFNDVALTDRRMARYPVFHDAARDHEEFAIRVRDDHHLNRHVNGCGCPCRPT